MEIRIPAKLNTSLSITGKSAGLHILDMTTVAVNLYDEIIVEEGEFSIELKGYNGLNADRFLPVLYRAAGRFFEKFGRIDCRIKVTKNVPLGAGMGGSSTAIVGVVSALAKVKNVALDDGFLLSLGSDVPAVYRGGQLHVTGVGDTLEQLPYVQYYFVVLVPFDGVDSGMAYSLYDAIGSFEFGVRKNDLELSARKLNSSVVTARRALEKAGAEDVVMSGSGSAVSAVFENSKDARLVFDAVEWDGQRFLLESVR